MEDYSLDVSMLRNLLVNKNIPDDAKVCIERIEDKYFDKHGWEPIFIPDYYYPSAEFAIM